MASSCRKHGKTCRIDGSAPDEADLSDGRKIRIGRESALASSRYLASPPTLRSAPCAGGDECACKVPMPVLQSVPPHRSLIGTWKKSASATFTSRGRSLSRASYAGLSISMTPRRTTRQPNGLSAPPCSWLKAFASRYARIASVILRTPSLWRGTSACTGRLSAASASAKSVSRCVTTARSDHVDVLACHRGLLHHRVTRPRDGAWLPVGRGQSVVSRVVARKSATKCP